MMTGIAKKLTAVILAIAMVVTLIPILSAQPVYAEDTRTEITEIVATSNLITPEYGAAIPYPEITVETGFPAYFSQPEWLKKTDDDWEIVDGGTFVEGTYTCSAILRVDGGYGSEYKLGWPITVTVDGVVWTTGWDGPEVYDSYSRLGIGSPEYVVTAPPDAPLVFSDSSSFDIGNSYVGDPIPSFSVSSAVSGGESPFEFSKTAGPDWITVSSDGTISGTPTATGKNENLVVQVEDKKGATAQITIAVQATLVRPEDREDITRIIASSDIPIPKYGMEVRDPDITVETGFPAWFAGAEWLKKTEDDWVVIHEGAFTTGTYKCSAMIRIDGEYGTQYKLGWPLTVTVDGETWTSGWDGPEIYDSYSRIGIGSPEFVVRRPIEDATVSGISDKTYTGKKITQTPVVKLDGEELTAGTDYEVTYKNNTNAGKATVTITGINQYSGTITRTFKITPVKLSFATLKYTELTYNGKERTQNSGITVKAKVNGTTKTLKSGTDYTVSYKNNKDVGEATVTIKGKGNYSGSKTVTFKINPKGTSLKTPTAASKAITVKWTKQATKMSTKRITGYQIRIATDSKFTKNKKTFTVEGYSKVSKKVEGLKAKKTYYVKIRTYKTVDGKTYYSAWSDPKTVTTKK